MTLPQRPTPTRSREDPPHLPSVCSEPQPGTWLWALAAGCVSTGRGMTGTSQATLCLPCSQSAFWAPKPDKGLSPIVLLPRSFRKGKVGQPKGARERCGCGEEASPGGEHSCLFRRLAPCLSAPSVRKGIPAAGNSMGQGDPGLGRWKELTGRSSGREERAGWGAGAGLREPTSLRSGIWSSFWRPWGWGEKTGVF